MKRLLLPFFLLTTMISIAQIRLVEDILPGIEQSNPFQFLEHDGFLFFIGQSTGGPAIFMMDTNESISIAWQEGFNAYDMIVYNNDLYFNANNQLHRLNRPYGTGSGSTVVDSAISMWGSAFVYNGELYFGGEINQVDPLNPNHELMAFNGTTVRLVEDQSTISLDPSQYVEHLGELYFVGKESATIGGLLTTVDAIYRSDGTSVEIVTFFENTSVSYLTSLGDNLYFLYRNGDFNQPYNLWYNNTNGTGGFGVELNFAFGLTVFENKLLFFDQDNTQLVSRDILGNEEIIPIAAGLEYPLGGFPLQNQNYLAFSGFTNAFGSELYIYEAGGEINFTEDYNSGSNSFTPVYGSFFNGSLYVTGSDGSGIGRELHVYNPNGCNETVNIPDANFEAYLENVLNVGDGILGNGLVCKEKVEVLTTLNLSGSIPIVNFPPGLGITNLAGIENFSALEVLRVEGNNIASINLSQNTSLRELRAWRCNIQTLNVSGLTNLQTVGLNFNSINTADFSTCPAIQELDITDNDLTAIQLGTKANLIKFTISNNPNLASLDISEADTNLSTFNATGNPTLTCIQVSNVTNAEAQSNWLKDANTSYSTNCNPQPFTVTASIPGATGNPLAIEITEGNSFTLNFDSGPTAPNDTQYTPNIQFTLNGNPGTADFSFNGNATLPTAPFTVTNPGPDGSITILALEDNLVEKDETYTITISSPDTSLFTIEGPTSFEVTVKDVSTEYSGEPFTLSATLAGDVQNNTINEGGTIEIWIEAILPNEAEGFDFNFNYEVQGIGGLTNEDYEIISNNPFNFQINNGVNGNPDGRLEIVILTDSYFDPNEKIKIVLEPINNFYVDWENGNFSDGERGQVEFEIEIKNISTSTASIFGVLSNTGGTEGNGVEGGLGLDTFTLTLKNSDGTDYFAEEDLLFDIIFSEDESVPEISRAIIGKDYLVTTPAQIRIDSTESSGSISVQLPQETEPDDQHEFYLVTVENPSPPINIDLPQPLQAKIIDDEGKFTVYYSIEEGNLTLEAENGNSCCNYYGVEEGELIRYRFMHEKGVVSNYEVKLNYGGGNDPFILDTLTVSSATKGRNNPVSQRNDFYSTAETEFETDENDIEFEKFTVTTPIYDFRIKVNSLDEKGEAPERFSASFSEYSSNFNLVLAEDTHDTDFDFLIEEAIPASIVANDKEASENPLENAQFTVTLDELNTGNNLTVYYEVDFNNSSSENDIEELSGSVVILNNQQSATINVVPINDPDFELEETLIIRLLDGPRYSVNETSAQDIISILSEDEANYTATMRSAEDNTSSELLDDDYAEVIIELNEPPTDDNIEVLFKISDQTNQSEVIEGEGEDYLIYQADKSTVIPSDNRKVVFEVNGGTRKSIFVKALLDGLDENNESLFLELDDGVNYRSGTPNGAEVILQSATTDLTSFDPNTISVVSNKPRCPGDNQEGFIEISNASGFEFDIVIYNDTENEVDRLLLGTNSSADRVKNSKPLTIGRYEIILEFKGEKPENAIAPRYVVQIEKLEDMSVEEQGVDLKSKTGSFLVSGSQSYTLSSQIGEYHFDFEDTDEHLITLPLEPGLNSIEIKGDTVCLGTIKKEILLEDIYIFPNPTNEIVSLMGESLKEFKGLVLFDMQGKLVFEKTTTDRGIDKLEINISSLQKGMYLGKIRTGNNQTIEFKLIKR